MVTRGGKAAPVQLSSPPMHLMLQRGADEMLHGYAPFVAQVSPRNRASYRDTHRWRVARLLRAGSACACVARAIGSSGGELAQTDLLEASAAFDVVTVASAAHLLPGPSMLEISFGPDPFKSLEIENAQF